MTFFPETALLPVIVRPLFTPSEQIKAARRKCGMRRRQKTEKAEPKELHVYCARVCNQSILSSLHPELLCSPVSLITSNSYLITSNNKHQAICILIALIANSSASDLKMFWGEDTHFSFSPLKWGRREWALSNVRQNAKIILHQLTQQPQVIDEGMGSERKGCYRPLIRAQAKTGQLGGLFSKSRHRIVGEEEDTVCISASSVDGNAPLIKVFPMLHPCTHIFIYTDLHTHTHVCTQRHTQRNVYTYTYAHIHYRGIHRDIYADTETHVHTNTYTLSFHLPTPFSSSLFIVLTFPQSSSTHSSRFLSFSIPLSIPTCRPDCK